jgi:hypothetical protein
MLRQRITSFVNSKRLRISNRTINNMEQTSQQQQPEDKRKKLYAASKNKDPILQVLRSKILELLQSADRTTDEKCNILEIASGTGEHASYFMENISNHQIQYLCSDPDSTMQESLQFWIEETQPKTDSRLLLPPIPFDINHPEQVTLPFQPQEVNVIICINMVHISPWESTLNLFKFASKYLDKKSGLLFTYGPYSIKGEMVESNHAFHRSLLERNPEWGVRDTEVLREEAFKEGLVLSEIIPMPSNNFSLIFRRA